LSPNITYSAGYVCTQYGFLAVFVPLGISPPESRPVQLTPERQLRRVEDGQAGSRATTYHSNPQVQGAACPSRQVPSGPRCNLLPFVQFTPIAATPRFSIFEEIAHSLPVVDCPALLINNRCWRKLLFVLPSSALVLFRPAGHVHKAWKLHSAVAGTLSIVAVRQTRPHSTLTS
jgi:hypothetical protein